VSGERRIDIAPAAIARVVAAVALVWLWLHLWQLAMVVLIAIVVAIGLEPAVRWLETHGVSRSIASALVVTLLAATIAGFFWITGASLARQARELGGTLSGVRQQVEERVPPALRGVVAHSEDGAAQSTLAGFAFWLPTRRGTRAIASTSRRARRARRCRAM
jgi:predicted PurR-regulated permease PerM